MIRGVRLFAEDIASLVHHLEAAKLQIRISDSTHNYDDLGDLTQNGPLRPKRLRILANASDSPPPDSIDVAFLEPEDSPAADFIDVAFFGPEAMVTSFLKNDRESTTGEVVSLLRYRRLRFATAIHPMSWVLWVVVLTFGLLFFYETLLPTARAVAICGIAISLLGLLATSAAYRFLCGVSLRSRNKGNFLQRHGEEIIVGAIASILGLIAGLLIR